MLDGCVLWGNRVIVPLAGRREDSTPVEDVVPVTLPNIVSPSPNIACQPEPELRRSSRDREPPDRYTG